MPRIEENPTDITCFMTASTESLQLNGVGGSVANLTVGNVITDSGLIVSSGNVTLGGSINLVSREACKCTKQSYEPWISESTTGTISYQPITWDNLSISSRTMGLLWFQQRKTELYCQELQADIYHMYCNPKPNPKRRKHLSFLHVNECASFYCSFTRLELLKKLPKSLILECVKFLDPMATCTCYTCSKQRCLHFGSRA